jgi:histidyl-tRNA synthetase
MAVQKPGTPKGTRDFSPDEMVKRNYLFDTIKVVFQRYGYMPIETPAMENIDTLTGKYGEEGDQLLFKILNSRPHEAKDNVKAEMQQEFARMLTHSVNSAVLTEKALRYDLTVPFARYVVQHQNDIAFPFKRYQIQPVWRGDRPAKGRYREFYQCDADVIGSNSLLNEVELVQLIDEVFSNLKLPVIIKINNRKILSGIAEVIGEKEKIVDITVAIDKLDKIGVEGVNKELREKLVAESAITQLQPLIVFRGDNTQKISLLKSLLAQSEIGKKGIAEIEYIFELLAEGKNRSAICELDITLARGLNYYTGAIFEVKADPSRCATQFGSSITGGGRYDDLTGIFGLPNLSGVGISFGADRIYDVLLELNLFPDTVTASTQLMFAHFGEAEQRYCLSWLAEVRAAGISAELYPDTCKIKKQFDYANKKKIAYVAVVGTEEMKGETVMLKNMGDGTQQQLKLEQVIQLILGK